MLFDPAFLVATLGAAAMKQLPGQLSMFAPPKTGRDAYAEAEKPAVPLNSTVPDHERPRLSAQHETILAALRRGPMTNIQLAAISQRFGARLHELRRAGHDWKRETVQAGVYRYTLEPESAKS